MKQPKFLDGSGVEEARAQWEHYRDSTTPLETGFANLDETWNPATGQFVILAGRPGGFKTTLAWQIGCHLASRGRPVLWFNIEPTMAHMYEMFISRQARIPRRLLSPRNKGSLTSELASRMSEAVEEFLTLPIVFHFQDIRIANAIRRATGAARFDAVFVDYLQLLNAPGSSPERIEAVSHALRDLAHTHNIFVCALVQMNRSIENGDEKNRLPRLSDLAGSAALEADADIVSFTYDIQRHGDLANFAVYTAKNRFGRADVFDRMTANAAMCEVHESRAVPMPLKAVAAPYQDTDDAKEQP